MICLEVYRPYEELKHWQNSFENSRKTDLMDRILFNKVSSINQIIKGAEKLLSKPIILEEEELETNKFES